MLDIADVRAAIESRLALIPSGIPALVFFDNEELDPDPNVSYLTVSVRHLTHTVDTFAVSNGHATDTGRVIFTVYQPNGTGTAAFDACMLALRTYFASGTTLAAGSDAITVSRNPGPFPGNITRLDAGASYQQLTVPWYALVRTTVVA